MKESISQFIAAVPFLAFSIIAQPDKHVKRSGTTFGYAFHDDYCCPLNMPARQGNLICPTPEYAGITQAFGKVVSILRNQGNNPFSGEVSL